MAATDKTVSRVQPLEAGDLVQLNPLSDLNGFEGSILCVTEVRSWGVIGFVRIPRGGQAYFRAEHSEFARTGGKAAWMPPFGDASEHVS